MNKIRCEIQSGEKTREREGKGRRGGVYVVTYMYTNVSVCGCLIDMYV